jgi:tetratricopeptide (TPR) repeat protein
MTHKRHGARSGEEYAMDLLNVDYAQQLFASMNQQTSKLESLANNALKNGIDRYIAKDYEGAIKEFKRAIGLAQDSSYAPDAADYMAKAYLQLGDTEGAIKSYQTATQLNPYRDDMQIKLGNLYYADQRYQEAESAYKEAVRIYPSTNNRYALGQVYLSLERYSEAETQFNEIISLEPDRPNGNFGLGLALNMQQRHEDAIRHFERAIEIRPDFYDAYAEMGYTYADLGEMDEAREMIDFLDRAGEADLADAVNRYMYKVDPPKLLFAYSTSTFAYQAGNNTPLSALDAYLENANASKTFTMVFQFDKEMDRESVENISNWQIGRSMRSGPGQAYNFGTPVPSTEVSLSLLPESVLYHSKSFTATVNFTVQQNASADGTIDPSHIDFKFMGKDAFGFSMNADFDQFTGFSGSA